MKTSQMLAVNTDVIKNMTQRNSAEVPNSMFIILGLYISTPFFFKKNIFFVGLGVEYLMHIFHWIFINVSLF